MLAPVLMLDPTLEEPLPAATCSRKLRGCRNGAAWWVWVVAAAAVVFAVLLLGVDPREAGTEISEGCARGICTARTSAKRTHIAPQTCASEGSKAR